MKRRRRNGFLHHMEIKLTWCCEKNLEMDTAIVPMRAIVLVAVVDGVRVTGGTVGGMTLGVKLVGGIVDVVHSVWPAGLDIVEVEIDTEVRVGFHVKYAVALCRRWSLQY